MGQYYKFVNIDKKEICDRNRHGYKLMEHSYVNNDYCNDILRLLSNEWKGDRVIHVGDYAESTDSSNTANIIENLSNELGINHTIYSYAEGFKNVVSKNNNNIRVNIFFILNHKPFLIFAELRIMFLLFLQKLPSALLLLLEFYLHRNIFHI